MTDSWDLASMHARLVRSGLLARLRVVASTGSTNDDLMALAPTWPAPALLVADHQTHGHGRVGRHWTSPAGRAVLASMLLRPEVPTARLGWLPLISGLAVVRALRDLGAPASLKWPNDVLLDAPSPTPGAHVPGWGTSRKIAGLLCQIAPEAVVVGIGINVGHREQELPVASATSLHHQGIVASRQEVIEALVAHEIALVARWSRADGDAVMAGIAQECQEACATIGTAVRVDLGGGRTHQGQAIALADDGALRVLTPDGVVSVYAGDVAHLRSATDLDPQTWHASGQGH